MRAAARLRASSSETVPFLRVLVLFLGDPERDLGQVLELGRLLLLEGDLEVPHREQHDPEEADKGQPDDHVNLVSDREFEKRHDPCPRALNDAVPAGIPANALKCVAFSGIMVLKVRCKFSRCRPVKCGNGLRLKANMVSDLPEIGNFWRTQVG